MCGILVLVSCESVGDKSLDSLSKRGPDSTTIVKFGPLLITFSRLAIIGLNDNSQPFKYFTDGELTDIVVCNGEIYNYKSIANDLNIDVVGKSDCSVLFPLIQKYGIDNIDKYINAEYSMVHISLSDTSYIISAKRDVFGIRPMFIGYNSNDEVIGFSSEAKMLLEHSARIAPMKPNTVITTKVNINECGEFVTTTNITIIENEFDSIILDREFISNDILTMKNNLINAVRTRLVSERKIGFLLSGGLDSSLVLSIASRFMNPEDIVCFTVGLEGSPDIEMAKQVAEYLNIPRENHHIVKPICYEEASEEDIISDLHELIYSIETYDITTIRASIYNMTITKYIRDNTDIKVILSGEGSDEVNGGYKYFNMIKNEEFFRSENIRLLRELYMFDNLRADRCSASCSLEVRVPFLDKYYVNSVLKLEPRIVDNINVHIEKSYLRDAFIGYLPYELLYRKKDAFSDAVNGNKGMTWQQWLEYYLIRNNIYSLNDDELPVDRERKFYKSIYVKFFPNDLIEHYWLPRFEDGTIMKDPSGRLI